MNTGVITRWGRKLFCSLPPLLLVAIVAGQEGFRVWPYMQNPAPEAMTILWFSEDPAQGTVRWWNSDSTVTGTLDSDPEPAAGLAYTEWEDTLFFDGNAPPPPYRHRIRLEGLQPGTRYHYEVIQGTDEAVQGKQKFRSAFKTAPSGLEPIRIIVFADSETEPESTGNFTSWPDPESAVARRYLLDQTAGFRNNIEIMSSRQPDLVLIAGDLTQHGGEQRDWDEFWRHLTDSVAAGSLAGQAAILPSPGNHEYYEGTFLDRYHQPGSERALDRYLTYFDLPANKAVNPRQQGRYHATTYGPVTIISLDVCNNGINGSTEDTNFYLLGESDGEGGDAPDFAPGSVQYQWLEDQLKEAQQNSLFTFVMFHHAPYSGGPHGYPAGIGDSLDNQSGVPVRVLTPLFLQYGVDAVFSGHDEMWERSVVTGLEILPGGSQQDHILHFYDVGTAGDGLRGPEEGLDNPNRAFLVHTDVPEQWENGILKAGGKHYGHLEVNIFPGEESKWTAELTPVCAFPLYNEADSVYEGWERRIYDDVVLLTAETGEPGVGTVSRPEPAEGMHCFPNPFHRTTQIQIPARTSGTERLIITDIHGRKIRQFSLNDPGTGAFRVEWDGTDRSGRTMGPGIYIVFLDSGERVAESRMLIRLP